MKCRKIKHEKMISYKIVFDKMYFACIIKHVSSFPQTRRGKERAYMDEEKISYFGHLI